MASGVPSLVGAIHITRKVYDVSSCNYPVIHISNYNYSIEYIAHSGSIRCREVTSYHHLTAFVVIFIYIKGST